MSGVGRVRAAVLGGGLYGPKQRSLASQRHFGVWSVGAGAGVRDGRMEGWSRGVSVRGFSAAEYACVVCVTHPLS